MEKTKIKIAEGYLNKDEIKAKVEEVFSLKNDVFYILETPAELKTGIVDSSNNFSIDCLDDKCLSSIQKVTMFDNKSELCIESDDDKFVFRLITENNGDTEVWFREDNYLLRKCEQNEVFLKYGLNKVGKDFLKDARATIVGIEYFKKEDPIMLDSGKEYRCDALVKAADRMAGIEIVDKKYHLLNKIEG